MLDFKEAFAAIFRSQAALAICVVALLIGLATVSVLLELRIKRNRLRDALSASRAAGSHLDAGGQATDHGNTGRQAGKPDRGVK